MIGAGEGGGIASIGAAQPVAAVTADIQKGVHLALRIAHHQHGIFTHIGGEKIAGRGNLALMAQKEPAAGKDLLQFLLVDRRLDEDTAA